MSTVRCPTYSPVQYPTHNYVYCIRCPTYNVHRTMSTIRYLPYDVYHPMSNVRYPTYNFYRMMSTVQCLPYHVQRTMSTMRCPSSNLALFFRQMEKRFVGAEYDQNHPPFHKPTPSPLGGMIRMKSSHLSQSSPLVLQSTLDCCIVPIIFTVH